VAVNVFPDIFLEWRKMMPGGMLEFISITTILGL
jgi:hypothetical protein